MFPFCLSPQTKFLAHCTTPPLGLSSEVLLPRSTRLRIDALSLRLQLRFHPRAPTSSPGRTTVRISPAGHASGGPLPGGGERRGVVPLRPLGLGELLDGAVAVVRGYPRPVFALGAVVAVAGALLQLLVVLTLLRPVLQIDPGQPPGTLTATSEQLAGAFVGSAVTALFSTASALVLAGLVAPAVSRGTLAQALTLREAWAQLRPRLGALVGVSLLVTLAVVVPFAVGALLTGLAVAALGPAGGLVGILAVPGGLALGLHLYVRWGLAPLAVVLEGQGVRAALSRSAVLVRRSWWRVLGILVLTALVAGAVGQVLQVPFLLLTGNPLKALSTSDTSSGRFVVAALGGMLSATVVGPFAAAVRGLLYVDRRMRAEGLDVALAAARP